MIASPALAIGRASHGLPQSAPGFGPRATLNPGSHCLPDFAGQLVVAECQPPRHSAAALLKIKGRSGRPGSSAASLAGGARSIPLSLRVAPFGEGAGT